tara:strand:+ start:174 stop:740 length:567 start_codon:yes stop_codon:yes gene_type:complete
MDTKFRDDAISKNRLALRVTLAWAILSSISLFIVSLMSFSLYKSKPVRWLPVCSVSEFSVSESSYSPSYLRQMAKKVADLRLTYNPETIESRYGALLRIAEPRAQEELAKILNNEINVIKEKNISSVFYPEKVKIDSVHHVAQLDGLLQRSTRGLLIKPVYKAYQINFAFHEGELSPVAIKEIQSEKN